MDEQSKNPEIAAEQAPVKPKKLKRHFFLAVIGIALLLMILGQLLGNLIELPLVLLKPDLGGQWRFLLDYFSFIGIDLLVLCYCKLAEKDLLRSFGSAGKGGSFGNTGKNFALGLLFGFGMNGLCILLAWLHGDLHFSVGAFKPLYLLLGLVCVCVQSGAEELLCRGYMQGALSQRYPMWLAIAVNALLFGALHLANPGVTVLSVTEVVVIGLALSFVTWKWGSLWMAIGVHTAWNFTQSLLFGLPNSGIVSEGSFLHLEAARGSFFYDPGFGIEGALPSVVVSVMLGLAALFYRRRGGLGDSEAR